MKKYLENKEFVLKKYPLFFKLIFKVSKEGGFVLPQILVLVSRRLYQ